MILRFVVLVVFAAGVNLRLLNRSFAYLAESGLYAAFKLGSAVGAFVFLNLFVALRKDCINEE
jgi:hypothetical protein